VQGKGEWKKREILKGTGQHVNVCRAKGERKKKEIVKGRGKGE
jgi:hypothetical protein